MSVNNQGETSLTVAISTIGYMPAEQQAFRPHFSSDIYAVGIICFQALTGLELELRLSGLVVRREGKLQVYNRIYATVFNQSWLEGALASLRPYAEALIAWVDSGYQDESRLLRGQALIVGDRFISKFLIQKMVNELLTFILCHCIPVMTLL